MSITVIGKKTFQIIYKLSCFVGHPVTPLIEELLRKKCFKLSVRVTLEADFKEF